jgi:ferredoxin
MMATIKTENKEVNVNDGDSIIKACEELGVPFDCKVGACGVCKIDVVEGFDNLTPLTEEEKIMGMEGQGRLACQCKIKQGIVKIKF